MPRCPCLPTSPSPIAASWEGRPVAELRRSEPEQFAAFEAAATGFAFPGGESIADQVARTARRA